MNPTHVGVSTKGTRAHLCDSKGWSACSLKMEDLTPLFFARAEIADYDHRWCATCLSRLASEAVMALTLDGLEREEPSLAPGTGIMSIGTAVRALRAAVDALLEISKLDDATAVRAAVEAGLKIEAALCGMGDA
jgi:hypothetical protein